MLLRHPSNITEKSTTRRLRVFVEHMRSLSSTEFGTNLHRRHPVLDERHVHILVVLDYRPVFTRPIQCTRNPSVAVFFYGCTVPFLVLSYVSLDQMMFLLVCWCLRELCVGIYVVWCWLELGRLASSVGMPSWDGQTTRNDHGKLFRGKGPFAFHESEEADVFTYEAMYTVEK